MGIAFTANISHQIRQQFRTIRGALFDAFEQAVVGCSKEVTYMARLSPAIARIFSSIVVPGLSFSVRQKVIHQKPKVAFAGGSCELADLLVVVKYHRPNAASEARSILYQIKMSERGSPTKYKIDQTQLNLLSNWPAFSFGLKSDASKSQYNITPATLEFGSYMLEPRDSVKGDIRTGIPRCYGVCPYAAQVAAVGRQIVGFNNLSYKRGDVQTFFNHLAFEIGEPHNTPSVKPMIEALFRLVGLDPDPPNEFDGFWTEGPDDGFAVIEINIKERGDRGPRPTQTVPSPVHKAKKIPHHKPIARRPPASPVDVKRHNKSRDTTGHQDTPAFA